MDVGEKRTGVVQGFGIFGFETRDKNIITVKLLQNIYLRMSYIGKTTRKK